MDALELQRRWDAQQETYMPDREQRFAVMLDAVEAAVGDAPRVLDLAGGTGSISRRVLDQFPAARTVVVDIDAALLAIARATFAADDRARVVSADLATPEWVAALDEPAGSFDAVLTATALHWLTADRVAATYAEAGRLLRAGGVLINADHMADPDLPTLAKLLDAYASERSRRRQALDGAEDWAQWWVRLRAVPELADAVAERDRRFAERDSHHTELDEPSSWHVDALRTAGFREAGLLWRSSQDAAVIGLR
jgi:ubiquinone/menaquinone biosynthesis C-methylase UbiE